ncbi:MAG: N-acetyltransferase family protein [Hyphomicrobiales bacterium]
MDRPISIRAATEADGPTLSAIERESPLVLGDVAIAIDRGGDYFAAARLMADVTVLLAEVDGEPAGVMAGARHPALLGGKLVDVVYIHHARILPRFQRLGLGRKLAAGLDRAYPPETIATRYWYIARDNAKSQSFARAAANRWSFGPAHLALPADPNAEAVGRPATPADAETIAAMLNAAHEGEEMFVPYTAASLAERLSRAPGQYSWGSLRLHGKAVLGAWPHGDYVLVVANGPAGSRRTRSLAVLDYGCLPGGEDDLTALFRAAAAGAASRGFDDVTYFSSPGARLWDLLSGLGQGGDVFDFWTPGVPEPDGASSRGLYVDPIYF